jgi:hypothetical protein
MSRWLELLRRLGEGLLDLLSAELGELSGELRNSRAEFVRAAGLWFVAAGLFLISGGLLTLSLVWWLAQLLGHPWLSALLVAVVYAAIGLAVATVARRRMRAIETPFETAQRRWQDQAGWFQERVLGSVPAGEPELEPTETEIEVDDV